MTIEEIERLEGLVKAATEGPWLFRENGPYSEVVTACSALCGGEDDCGDCEIISQGIDSGPADAAFIAAAREALPALLAEVLRLRRLEDAARSWSKLHRNNVPEEGQSKFSQGALHAAVRALDS